MDIQKAIERKKSQLPQFEHMWRVTLPELNTKGVSDSTGKGLLNTLKKVKDFIFGTPDIGDDLSHRVYSVDFPYRSFSVNKNTFGSTFFTTPGNFEVGSCSIRVDEFEDGKTLKYFTDWHDMMVNDDGTYNPPVAYKRDLILTRMSASGADLHVSIYKNCFPSEISPSSMSYESGGVLQYHVVLSGDYVEHTIIDAGKAKSLIDEENKKISNLLK